MLINGVLDYEKSLCSDCALLNMCRIAYKIEEIQDPIVDINVIVEKCKAYEQLRTESSYKNIAHYCPVCERAFLTLHGLKIHQSKVHRDIGKEEGDSEVPQETRGS